MSGSASTLGSVFWKKSIRQMAKAPKMLGLKVHKLSPLRKRFITVTNCPNSISLISKYCRNKFVLTVNEVKSIIRQEMSNRINCISVKE